MDDPPGRPEEDETAGRQLSVLVFRLGTSGWPCRVSVLVEVTRPRTLRTASPTGPGCSRGWPTSAANSTSASASICLLGVAPAAASAANLRLIVVRRVGSVGIRRRRGGSGSPPPRPESHTLRTHAVAGRRETDTWGFHHRRPLRRTARRRPTVPGHTGASPMTGIDPAMFDLFREEVRVHRRHCRAGCWTWRRTPRTRPGSSRSCGPPTRSRARAGS